MALYRRNRPSDPWWYHLLYTPISALLRRICAAFRLFQGVRVPAMTKAPRLWFLGLAAFFAALTSSPALASGSASRPGSVAAVRPLPAASWHGRPIRHPQPVPGAAALAAWSPRGVRPALRIGAGYGRPNGLAAVRRVQRLLHRIGYRSGPVDGLFGPRTRASVQWFQIKHGLRPTGEAGSATVALLRLRAAGAALSPHAGPPPPAGVPAVTGPARHVPRPGA